MIGDRTVCYSSSGHRLVERRPVVWLSNRITRGYLPRWRWDTWLWLTVLRVLDRWDYRWKRP